MDYHISDETKYAIYLTLIFGFSSVVTTKLIKEYGSAENVYNKKINQDGEDYAKSSESVKNRIAKHSSDEVKKILSNCTKNNIGAISFNDDLYPEKLRNIYNPPAVLYYKGDISTLGNSTSVAIVGTRNPSEYSIHVVKSIVREISNSGFDIVSGFAVGVDINAHLSACHGGSKTYAVLGCGIDYQYPKPNVIYRDDIIANGAFISEYPPGTSPRSQNFPLRNRILAGISDYAVVIEAGAKSGSLNTANHINEQGKTLFVIPPRDIFDKSYSGNCLLLRDGATPLMNANDLIYDYQFFGNNDKLPNNKEINIKDYTEITPYISTSEKLTSDNTLYDNKIQTPAKKDYNFSSLPDEQKIIAEIIQSSESLLIADEIAEKAEMDISDVLMILTDMELDGIITSNAGKTFSLC